MRSVRKKPALFSAYIADEPVDVETAPGTKLAAERASVTMLISRSDWAPVPGPSRWFGLATAHKLSARRVNLRVRHRDRLGVIARIEPEFKKDGERGTVLLFFDADVLDRESRASIVTNLSEVIGLRGRIRVSPHSIAFGNLKLAPERRVTSPELAALATELAVEEHRPWEQSIGLWQG